MKNMIYICSIYLYLVAVVKCCIYPYYDPRIYKFCTYFVRCYDADIEYTNVMNKLSDIYIDIQIEYSVVVPFIREAELQSPQTLTDR